ncbi:MAG: glutamate--cysteine ligase [Gammaproteobacteria bacterium]
MRQSIEKNLNLINQTNMESTLRIGKVGIEKESLRTDKKGMIANTDHPLALGSALMHPFITTDYSEALLEFVTPPQETAEQAIEFLSQIHRFVYPNIGKECLWPASMPCKLNGEDSIRIAEYGSSNLGKMKNVYRRGLGYRYGKVMQVISGIHVNLSMPEEFWPSWQHSLKDKNSPQDFVNEQYFKLIRNLQRVGWLVPYLFGASPAVDKSFSHQGVKDLQRWDENTLYAQHATSLRLGDIGYTNHRENEIGIKACYDNLSEYVTCLTRAIEKPYAPYEDIGVQVDGEYRQLNANILQIENEYYSTVRPKQVARRNEKPTHALLDRGVQYVEIRSLDLNPFSPFGVSIEQLRFIEVLFVYCLLGDESIIDRKEREEIDINAYEVSHHGRNPDLHLRKKGKSISLKEWCKDIFTGLSHIAECMDKNTGNQLFSQAVSQFYISVESVEETFSARILSAMRDNNLSYYQYIETLGKQYCQFYAGSEKCKQTSNEISKAVEISLREQKQLEDSDTKHFPEFLADYFAIQYDR